MKCTDQFIGILIVLLLNHAAFAKIVRHQSQAQVRKPSQIVPCARLAPGTQVQQPKNLFSHNGQLKVDLTYESNLDEDGNVQFCYRTSDGDRSPTLHLNPDENLILTVTNKTAAPVASEKMQMQAMDMKTETCGPGTMMDSSTTNVHFHGSNVPPRCHQDESLLTMINAGQSFTYTVHFPKNEPAGLYWYHPHIHGSSEAALLGGASGAIIIGGIQHFQRKTAGLYERVLVIRDNLVPGAPKPSDTVPTWDLSLNFIPVAYPKYTPAVIAMRPNQKELWRVLNAAADTILDVQLTYDGVAQDLPIVGLDGVPTNSSFENPVGTEIIKKHILIPPAGRAEFIVTGPSTKVKSALFSTLKIQTGPAGDSDPDRPLASLKVSRDAPVPRVKIPHEFHIPFLRRFAELPEMKIKANRKLYFSESISNPEDPASPTDFFITVDEASAKPHVFNMSDPPAVTVTQGSVEEWTIENRSTENHEFHIHQIHFLLTHRNGLVVSKDDQQLLDTVEVPFWSGKATDPFPSVTLLMDFRGDIVGDFVYHCHILGHEDNGMMAKIRVLPKQ